MTDQVVALRIQRARGFRSRLVGLLGRPSMDPGQGLWIEPCACVHTFGMRFAIDLAFIDHQRTVLRLVHALRPWRVAACPGARAVIELRAGTVERLQLVTGKRWLVEPELP